MKATLFDVAKKARVSTATVSRVLNESRLVNQTTRDRVQRIIQALDYHPSHAARILAGQRTGMLGVVTPGIASGFFAEVLCGLDEVAAEYRFHLTTVFTHGREDEEKLLLRFLQENRCDGVAILNLSLPPSALARAQQIGLPVVLLDRPLPDTEIPSVCIDNTTGAMGAMRHLLEHGHRRIAILTGPRDNHDAIQRLAGAQLALTADGVALDPNLIWSGAFTEESGRAAMIRWLDTGASLPDAIFACNDAMALGALDALRSRGHHVPDDVALVGFDDCEAARYVALTTVRVPMRQMGRMAAETLIQQILHNEQRTPGLLPVSLIARRSCGCKVQEPAKERA